MTPVAVTAQAPFQNHEKSPEHPMLDCEIFLDPSRRETPQEDDLRDLPNPPNTPDGGAFKRGGYIFLIGLVYGFCRDL